MELARTQKDPASLSVESLTRVRPRTNVFETADSYLLQLLIPGVKKSDIDLEAEKGILRLRAKVGRGGPEGYSAYHLEFDGVSFERAFQLPKDVDATGVEAELASGVLTLTLPKSQEAKPRKIPVAG